MRGVDCDLLAQRYPPVVPGGGGGSELGGCRPRCRLVTCNSSAQQGARRAAFTLGPQWLRAEPAGSYGKDRDCQYAHCEHCPKQARPPAILAPGTPARRCPIPDGLGSHSRGGGTSQGSTANSPSGTRSAQTATAGVTRTSWRVTTTCPSSPLLRALRYTRQSYHWLWVTDYLGLVDEQGRSHRRHALHVAVPVVLSLTIVRLADHVGIWRPAVVVAAAGVVIRFVEVLVRRSRRP